MTNSFPPTVPDLDDFLTGPGPARESAFSGPSFMPSLKGDLEWGGDFADGLDPGPTEPRFQDVYGPPEFLWRYMDRSQGRYVKCRLPNELLAALQRVAEETVDPTTTLGESRQPDHFGNASALLAFVVDHVIRGGGSENRRNTRFAPESRRSYSFRLPTRLKQFFEILRPVAINPYTGQSFANVSQMIVFCLHVFVMAEPWTAVPGADLWRENRAASKPPRKDSRSNDDGGTNNEGEFSRVDGMSQMQVRIDSGFFDELAKAVEILSPAVTRQLKYRLTMSGFWISATAWSSRSINWGANPLAIQDHQEPAKFHPIDWREQAPPGLLLGR